MVKTRKTEQTNVDPQELSAKPEANAEWSVEMDRIRAMEDDLRRRMTVRQNGAVRIVILRKMSKVTHAQKKLLKQ